MQQKQSELYCSALTLDFHICCFLAEEQPLQGILQTAQRSITTHTEY